MVAAIHGITGVAYRLASDVNTSLAKQMMLLPGAIVVFRAARAILAAFSGSACSFVSEIHDASEASPRKVWVNDVAKKCQRQT
jgi:hypothetical protein